METSIENIKVKVSICPDCNGVIRAVIEHKLQTNEKIKKNFYNEVLNYGLNIKSIPLEEYKNNIPKWCECNV